VAIETTLADYQARAEAALQRWLPEPNIQPERLHDAMRYATLGGGKRVRPCLVYATGAALGVDAAQLDAPACAVELIHAYSLVHDDLPAMDDDDLRRGRATCHKAYDEATAILVGDALQSLAFYVLAHDSRLRAGDGARLKMIKTLALASGSRGMAGGQMLDMQSENRELSLAELENVHIHKTGALIRACVRLAMWCASDIAADVKSGLEHFGACIGLAFQIQDDILDVTGDTQTLGKRQGADQARNKSTYPSIMGLAPAAARADELLRQAIESLAPLGDRAVELRALAEFLVRRES
jgi:farnesyl diphosphate synthase